jgi:hypothetical protein
MPLKTEDVCRFCLLNSTSDCHLKPECHLQKCTICGQRGHGAEVCLSEEALLSSIKLPENLLKFLEKG